MTELIQTIVADRMAGLAYKTIARQRGISIPKVRQLLTHAVRDGIAKPDDVRYVPLPPRPAPDDSYDARWVEKVLARIKVSDTGCWIWQGDVGTWGYAQFMYDNRNKILHRLFYQIVNKVKLTRWQLVMHKCDQRLCVNPAHLRVGTPSENVKDAANKGRHHNARKTHCKRGHEFTPENTARKVGPKGNFMRYCVTCLKARYKSRRNAPNP